MGMDTYSLWYELGGYKMKKNIIILLIFSFILGGNTAFASGKINEAPDGAKIFAKQNFKNIVLDNVNSNKAIHFNLTKSKNITFSKLYPTYTMSKEFVKTQNKIQQSNKGLIKSGEWISVVYQDGKPKNVIGTFKADDGTYKLSTFGYGEDLAKELDKLKPSGKLIYEFPTDSWFLFAKGKVRALNTPAKIMLKQKINLGQFRKFVYGRYKNQDNIYKDGKAVSVGGSNLIPYKTVMDKNSFSNPFLVYMLGFGLMIIFSVFGLLLYKKRIFKIK